MMEEAFLGVMFSVLMHPFITAPITTVVHNATRTTIELTRTPWLERALVITQKSKQDEGKDDKQQK